MRTQRVVQYLSEVCLKVKPMVLAAVAAVLLGAQMMWAQLAEASDTGEPGRGALIEMDFAARFTVAEIDAAVGEEMPLIGPARCDVRVIRLKYATVGVAGEPADATAVLLLPEGDASCSDHPPLLGWARGTETRREASQAEQAAEVANFSLSAFYAAKGYAVVATDYLGLGGSSYPFHPYLHAASEATAIVDALRAARLAARELDAALADEVLLAGYSQGGHAVFAAQRLIESAYANEFNLVATVPMSGVYDVAESFIDAWVGSDERSGNPLGGILLTYTIVSYQNTYGTLYESPEELLRPPFAEAAMAWFPGPMTVFELYETPPFADGPEWQDLRQPAFVDAFRNDPQHPFRTALRKNNLDDWTPQTPTVFCGTSRDSIISFARTLRLAEDLRKRGAPVEAIDVDAGIPPEVDGLEAHAGWAAYLCYGAAHTKVFAPLIGGRDG